VSSVVAPPSSSEPIWEGEGAPLSTWALQPEEAQPYDPRNPDPAHVVAAGETLYTIAARRQAPLRALIDANQLSAPFRLEPGQVLILPPPAVHTVRSGETLAAIGRRYNVDLRSLALLNRLSAPFTLRPGDQLILPAGARGVEPPASPPPAPTPSASQPGPSGRFAWPVAGTVLSRFGAETAGGRAQSIDIEAAPGAPVRAPADGRVLFAGEGPAALGGLVILDHGVGLVTTVGFVTGFQVDEGQRVTQGQTLALASSTRVLFQVRDNGAARDPLGFLGQP
jgi:murein DD-endopeptidase MepM/ murein hydrolase activator NlpD